MRLFVVVTSLLTATTFVTGGQVEMKTPKVTFEVVPLKAVYHPDEPIGLRLILTNRGQMPVTVEHFSPQCSSDFFAFADVRIIDAAGKVVRGPVCAADSFLTEEAIKSEVSKVGVTNYWTKLEPGEFYGQQTSRQAIAQQGSYTVKAYLLPARFGEANRNLLAEKGITILSGKITAPDVHISVR